ncbi:hypothetical protein Btru_027347 [Bulinus truncatus]|nr:hypothetical protein Btru_027347 [Bulinus truncatus]
MFSAEVWLAVDVWLCTASILNLCCISLDRYLAITRPIRYPGLMSARRAKTLVAGVWLFSFIICCPPLVGWSDTSQNEPEMNVTTSQPILETTTTPTSFFFCDNSSFDISQNSSCSDSGDSYQKTCELTNSRGYRIYAALGSFFIPMLVMVFFYVQIYRAAVKTISAYAKGELKTKYSVRENGSKTNSVTLRIHRGGRGLSTSGSVYRQESTYGGGGACRHSTVNEGSGESSSNGRRYGRQENNGHLAVRKCRSSDTSLVTLTGLSCDVINNGDSRYCAGAGKLHRNSSSFCWKKEKKTSEGHDFFQTEPQTNGRSPLAMRCAARCISLESDESSSGDCKMKDKRCSENVRGSHYIHSPLTSTVSLHTEDTDSVYTRGSSHSESVYNRGSSQSEFKPRRCRLSAQKPGNAMKLHMQKFNREKKAAKTLAIIVGAFILCWMPFFTIYLVGAFCDGCISPLVFSIAFWLGYCNSAMNPCVYALFSRDFRFAFKKLITCKCKIWSKKRNFRPPTSDVPVIQLHCATQDEGKHSSDIGVDGQWR